MVWLQFIGLSLVIVIAGTKAARYADIIAEKTGLGRIRIGLVLLALVSSMPELSTGISAVSLVKLPDLALGTLLGSCLFNLLILVLLDVLYRRTPILSRASPSHMVSAGLGIILLSLTAGIILAGEGLSGLVLGWIGVPSIVVFLLYVSGMWGIFRYERNRQLAPAPAADAQYGEHSIGATWFKFALAAAAVIGAGIWLAFIGEEIVGATGWGTSFVGSLLLAVSTSMPELVIGVTALRIGAVDMAVANVLGANMINIAKIFVLDIFYSEGSLLSSVSDAHVTTAIVAVAMSLVVLLGLRFRQQRKTFRVVSWYAALLFGLYLYGAYALFSTGLGNS